MGVSCPLSAGLPGRAGPSAWATRLHCLSMVAADQAPSSQSHLPRREGQEKLGIRINHSSHTYPALYGAPHRRPLLCKKAPILISPLSIWWGDGATDRRGSSDYHSPPASQCGQPGARIEIRCRPQCRNRINSTPRFLTGVSPDRGLNTIVINWRAGDYRPPADSHPPAQPPHSTLTT